MQNLQLCPVQYLQKFRTTLYMVGVFLLSACSGAGSNSGPLPGAANPTNLAPSITDTSYNCDPISESASFKVGETDQFTLSVTDESPLKLTYSVDNSNTDAVNLTVDENGVFTIAALMPGESYLWLGTEDENGLTDEYELKVIVN